VPKNGVSLALAPTQDKPSAKLALDDIADITGVNCVCDILLGLVSPTSLEIPRRQGNVLSRDRRRRLLFPRCAHLCLLRLPLFLHRFSLVCQDRILEDAASLQELLHLPYFHFLDQM